MKMTPVKSGSRAQTPTVNPTSKTYWDDLHKAEFINGAQLVAAKSGNVKDIDKADAEAYEMAIKESIKSAKNPSTPKQDDVTNTEKDNQALIDYKHPLTPRQSEVIGSQFNVAHRPSDVALVNKYTKEGYRFVQSSNLNHNCLIISILQHLTKDYEEKSIVNHLADAKPFRDKLNIELKRNLSKAQKEKFDQFAMLESDNLTFLLSEMKKEERFKDKDLTVEIWTAGQNGEKVAFDIGNGKERVIIFQKTDHFVAVIPPKKASNSSNTTSSTPALAITTAQASTSVASTVSTTGTSASIAPARSASSTTVQTEKKN